MTLYRPFSPKFPYPPKNFVGREDDVKELMELIDFSDDESADIISIVGTPGIGKTALAVYVGNEMILNGVVVHYVNMKEFHNEHLKQEIAERILGNLASQSDKPANITFDRLLKWAGNRFWYNLIVLDDCDDCINSQKEEFQDAIDKLLFFSDNIKILTTSREIIVHSEDYHTYQLKPLSEESACKYLDLKLHSRLNDTGKRMIANLTGAMPLALKIVESLLNAKNPPTPEEIITKLESNPIPALTSSKLRQKLQLNFSIWLSYDFLSIKLRKIGRYLAHFPGSFEKDTATFILKEIFNETSTDEEYLTNSLNELVEHSLLELDELTQRYHFHRLIKEFFLLYSNHDESREFNFRFQVYYSLVLSLAAFSNERASALDIERHNIQHFMTIIQVYPTDRQFFYNTALTSFGFALEKKILGSLFSPKELIGPVRKVTDIVQGMLTEDYRNESDIRNLFLTFVQLLDSLSYLTQTLEGRRKALTQLMERENLVEDLESRSIPGIDSQYKEFYMLILLYKEYLDDDLKKTYHTRILRKVYDPNFCRSSECDFATIGKAYYQLEIYPECIYFYERALQNDTLARSFDAISVLLNLRDAYTKSRSYNSSFTEAIDDQLLDLFPLMMNQTFSKVHHNSDIYESYYMIFHEMEEFNASLAIGEKLIESYSAFNWTKDKYEVVLLARLVAEVLLKRKEFERAANMATSILKFFNDTKQQHFMASDYIEIRLLFGEATYSLGNFSEADVIFVSTLKFISENNLTHIHYLDCVKVCSYLLYLGNLEHIYSCYLSSLFGGIKANFGGLFHAIFGLPFNCQKQNDILPTPIIQFSKSLSVSKKGLSSSLTSDVFASLIKKNEMYDTMALYKYPRICFLLNAASIFVRVYITVLLLSMFCYGFLSAIVLCHLMGFSDKLILLEAKIFSIFLMNFYIHKFSFIFLFFMNAIEFLYRYTTFYLTLWSQFFHLHVRYVCRRESYTISPFFFLYLLMFIAFVCICLSNYFLLQSNENY